MFRTGLLACLLSLPVAAQQPFCRPYEYAELKDMGPERLSVLYCDYHKTMRGTLDGADAEIRRGRLAASQRYLAEGNHCAQELDRIERLLKAKPAC